MVSFQEETVEQCMWDVAKLAYTHWDEVASNKEERPLNINWPKYIELNRAGIIRAFTAREDNGNLVGYISFLISDHLRYKSWKYAQSDVYFVDQSTRGQGIGRQLFEEAEAWLKSLGVKSVIIQEKVKNPHEQLFTSLGFTLLEKLYEKVL
jgi:GNAT superfamily N-acetyltransferase